MSRAGLVSLILFFLYTTLVASAPLPDHLSSDIESFALRSGDYDHDPVTRSPDFDLLEDRGLYFLKERDFDIANDNYYTREVTAHTESLYRRTKVTQKVKAAFQKAGAAIKHGFQKAGAAIKKGFQKVGAAIKTGAKKVINFVKTNVKKVAKFALKVVSAAAGVLGTVARVIPGVGSGIAAGLKGVSAASDAASNAIHANLGKKLEKGVKVLNIIKDPIGAGINAAVNKATKHK